MVARLNGFLRPFTPKHPDATLIAKAYLLPKIKEELDGYLEWGAMTSSDRELWADKFRALLAALKQ